MKRVALIVIGNEVLNGSTLDTNSHFMCQYVEAHDSKVIKIITIPDNPDIIKTEIQDVLKCVDVVITFGGLGPTNDDLTISAVSKAIDRKLIHNSLALTYVNDRYNTLAEAGIVEKNPSNDALKRREKMAIIPEESTPLWNPIGAAPAVVIPFNQQYIICFPGVPREISSICSKYDKEVFEKILGQGVLVSYRLLTSTNDESELAMPIKKVAGQYNNLYIKSRPVFGSDRQEIGITVTGSGKKESDILSLINGAIQDLRCALSSSGITITSTTRII